MKFLFSPVGLIVILVIAFILFFPQRLPDAAKKLRRPMRAFPDEPEPEDSTDPEDSVAETRET